MAAPEWVAFRCGSCGKTGSHSEKCMFRPDVYAENAEPPPRDFEIGLYALLKSLENEYDALVKMPKSFDEDDLILDERTRLVIERTIRQLRIVTEAGCNFEDHEEAILNEALEQEKPTNFEELNKYVIRCGTCFKNTRTLAFVGDTVTHEEVSEFLRECRAQDWQAHGSTIVCPTCSWKKGVRVGT